LQQTREQKQQRRVGQQLAAAQATGQDNLQDNKSSALSVAPFNSHQPRSSVCHQQLRAVMQQLVLLQERLL
jgi:hypothetical protein